MTTVASTLRPAAVGLRADSLIVFSQDRRARAPGALRLSLGRFSTPGDIETAATLISEAADNRAPCPASTPPHPAQLPGTSLRHAVNQTYVRAGGQ
ncbi:MAG TPA: hypothetical protein VGH53_19400 [Streptosporangiaceae bacterium]